MARKWFNLKEITQALRSAGIENIIIEKITYKLPLEKKRESTDEEKRLQEELKAMTQRKDEAVKFLKFWKEHNRLTQNKGIEEELNKQINIIETHHKVIK